MGERDPSHGSPGQQTGSGSRACTSSPAQRKLIRIWFTNADVLTQDKLLELKSMIRNSAPEIIAVTEVKPKNFHRSRTDLEYQNKIN